jgi:hypothetical protein
MFGVIGLILIGLCLYMATDVVNPLLEAKVDELVDLNGFTKADEVYPQISSLVAQGVIKDYVSPQRVAIVIAVAIAGITSLFMAIHTFIDKLFFKEFYRQANIWIAIRRGIFLAIALGAAIVFHFLGMAWLPALLPVPLVFIIDMLIMAIIRARKEKKLHIVSDIIDSSVESDTEATTETEAANTLD